MIEQHGEFAVQDPVQQGLLQHARLGSSVPMPRDYTRSAWVMGVGEMLSEIGLSEWMDPAGATLPEGWRAELKAAIHRFDQHRTMADLFSSSQHLVLYRQVIHGSRGFFRWQASCSVRDLR